MTMKQLRNDNSFIHYCMHVHTYVSLIYVQTASQQTACWIVAMRLLRQFDDFRTNSFLSIACQGKNDTTTLLRHTFIILIHRVLTGLHGL